MIKTMRRRLQYLVPVVVLTAGCGSTALSTGAAGDGTTLTQGSTDGGLSLPGSTGGGTTGGTVGGSLSSGTGGAVAPGTTTGGSFASGGGSTGAGSAATGGVTGGTSGGSLSLGRPVKVGVATLNTAALAAAAGVANNDNSDYLQNVLDYVNAHGGFGGNKVEWHMYQANVQDSYDVQGQAACQAFTQDSKMDIVFNVGILGSTFPACLRQRGVAVVDNSFWTQDVTDMQSYRNWLQPAAMRIDRIVKGLLSLSGQMGYIKSGDVLGVMVEDCPWGRRVLSRDIEPLAQKLGVKLVTSSFSCNQNLVSGLGTVSQEAQQAELKFASNVPPVTHVMAAVAAEGFTIAQFQSNASKQNYHPKYLVTSNAAPNNSINGNSGAVQFSEDALPNIFGAGWMSLYDLGAKAWKHPVNAAQGAAQTRCLSATGYNKQPTDPEYYAVEGFYTTCDAVFALKALLENNGMKFSVPLVRQGYAALKNRMVAASTEDGLIGGSAESSDGASSMRPFRYDTATKHFVYTGPPVRIP